MNSHSVQAQSIKMYWMPLSAAIMSYAVTLQLIAQWALGKAEIAGHIGLMQACFAVTFYIFSGDARNIVLSQKSPDKFDWILRFRLKILVPITVSSLAVSIVIFDALSSLVVILCLRKITEWVGQLGLARHENQQRIDFCRNYALSECAALFFGLLLQLFFDISFAFAMLCWALVPLGALITKRDDTHETGHVGLRDMFPFVGSSIVIGVSTLVLRILLDRYLGTEVAGQVLAYFAIASIIPTVIGNVIAPSVLRHGDADDKAFFQRTLNARVLVILAMLVTAMFFLVSWYFTAVVASSGSAILSLQLSLPAVILMYAALTVRSLFLSEGRSVLTQDAIANGMLVLLSLLIVFANQELCLVSIYLLSSIFNFSLLIVKLLTTARYEVSFYIVPRVLFATLLSFLFITGTQILLGS